MTETVSPFRAVAREIAGSRRIISVEEVERAIRLAVEATRQEMYNEICDCCAYDDPPKLDPEEGWTHYYDDGGHVGCAAHYARDRVSDKKIADLMASKFGTK